MGRLERHLDASLVARIKTREDGTVYIPRTEAAKPLHKVKPPRMASSYRGATRNDLRKLGWPDKQRAKERPLAKPRRIKLNRSENLPTARTYAEAAEIARGKAKAA